MATPDVLFSRAMQEVVARSGLLHAPVPASPPTIHPPRVFSTTIGPRGTGIGFPPTSSRSRWPRRKQLMGRAGRGDGPALRSRSRRWMLKLAVIAPRPGMAISFQRFAEVPLTPPPNSVRQSPCSPNAAVTPHASARTLGKRPGIESLHLPTCINGRKPTRSCCSYAFLSSSSHFSSAPLYCCHGHRARQASSAYEPSIRRDDGN
jgi:hypothetical protein